MVGSPEVDFGEVKAKIAATPPLTGYRNLREQEIEEKSRSVPVPANTSALKAIPLSRDLDRERRDASLTRGRQMPSMEGASNGAQMRQSTPNGARSRSGTPNPPTPSPFLWSTGHLGAAAGVPWPAHGVAMLPSAQESARAAVAVPAHKPPEVSVEPSSRMVPAVLKMPGGTQLPAHPGSNKEVAWWEKRVQSVAKLRAQLGLSEVSLSNPACARSSPAIASTVSIMGAAPAVTHATAPAVSVTNADASLPLPSPKDLLTNVSRLAEEWRHGAPTNAIAPALRAMTGPAVSVLPSAPLAGVLSPAPPMSSRSTVPSQPGSYVPEASSSSRMRSLPAAMSRSPGPGVTRRGPSRSASVGSRSSSRGPSVTRVAGGAASPVSATCLPSRDTLGVTTPRTMSVPARIATVAESNPAPAGPVRARVLSPRLGSANSLQPDHAATASFPVTDAPRQADAPWVASPPSSRHIALPQRVSPVGSRQATLPSTPAGSSRGGSTKVPLPVPPLNMGPGLVVSMPPPIGGLSSLGALSGYGGSSTGPPSGRTSLASGSTSVPRGTMANSESTPTNWAKAVTAQLASAQLAGSNPVKLTSAPLTPASMSSLPTPAQVTPFDTPGGSLHAPAPPQSPLASNGMHVGPALGLPWGHARGLARPGSLSLPLIPSVSTANLPMSPDNSLRAPGTAVAPPMSPACGSQVRSTAASGFMPGHGAARSTGQTTASALQMPPWPMANLPPALVMPGMSSSGPSALAGLAAAATSSTSPAAVEENQAMQFAATRVALDKVKQAEERARKAEENARLLREELEAARSEADRLSKFEPRKPATDADQGRDPAISSQAKLVEGIRQRDLTASPVRKHNRKATAREPSEGIIERAVDAMSAAMGAASRASSGRRRGKAAASDIATWTWGHSNSDDEVDFVPPSKTYSRQRAEAEMQLLPDVVHL